MARRHIINVRILFALGAAFIIMLGLSPRVVFASPSGSGTEGDPYVANNNDELQMALESGGYVRLGDDVQGGFSVPEGKSVDLDLHSHTISLSVDDDAYTMTVYAGGSLTVRDSGEEGAIVASGHSAVSVDGALVMYGGLISASASDADVSGVVNNGSFTMYGGTISGGYGVANQTSFTIASGGTDGTISGASGAISGSGTVKNEVTATGWTEVDNPASQVDIPPCPDGQQFSADYKMVRFPSIAIYEVNVSTNPVSGGGTASGDGEYAYYDSATLTATPATGYHFVNWTTNGDLASTDNPYTFTVEGDTSLVANFEPDKFKITFVDEDGTVIQAATEYDYGTAADDIAKPADPTKDGTSRFTYKFSGWKPDISSVTADATYTATYDEIPVTATLTFDLAGGTLDGKTGSVTVTANVGDTIQLPAEPTRDGHEFKYWKGSKYAAGADYEVVGDHTFTAVWKENSRPEPDPDPTPAPDPDPTPEPGIGALAITGSGHVQSDGNCAATKVTNGIVIGTTGQSKRLEAISVSLPKDTDGNIEYRGHLQGIGWSDWCGGGETCGTVGESRRLEALQMRLSGDVAKSHSVWYRVHSQTFGWLGWAHDGESAGTAGQSKRAEAVEVQVLPKGQEPEDYAAGQASYVGAVTGDVHVQGEGWLGSESALAFGTTGQSRRLEALQLSVPNQPEAGGIEYKVHVQGTGWMPAAADGDVAGTTGQSRRLEAVRVDLVGDMANEHSVWYRVHSQTYGWLGWAHDGDTAGTTGLAKRAEAVEIQVLPKGQVPDGYDAGVPSARIA